MTQIKRLSKREREVVKLLLQGKSNKLIASSLAISVRTVEFHLKNIYAKFQVNSRVEMILKLRNTTGKAEIENLGYSTVDSSGESAENRDRYNTRMDWATSFRSTISIIGKELAMKNLLNSKHILVGTITALFAGFLWMLALASHSADEIKTWAAPLIAIWLIIGFSVGLIGKSNNIALTKVGISALLATGLSPLTIIPLMAAVVLPVGKFAEWLGLIDLSIVSSNVATTLTAIIMLAIWLVVGVTIGIVWLFVTIKKPEPPIVQQHVPENG